MFSSSIHYPLLFYSTFECMSPFLPTLPSLPPSSLPFLLPSLPFLHSSLCLHSSPFLITISHHHSLPSPLTISSPYLTPTSSSFITFHCLANTPPSHSLTRWMVGMVMA